MNKPTPSTATELVVIDKKNEESHLAIVDQAQEQRIARILELSDHLPTFIEDTKQRIRRSMNEVIEAGKLLIEEKEAFHNRCGKYGAWTKYFNHHFPNIPMRTANHWMTVASKAILAISEGEPMANVERKVMSQMELFPTKEYQAIEGEATVPQMTNHLTAVNYFSKWVKPISEQKMKLTDAQKLQLRADFKPVYDFLTELFNDQTNE